MKRLETFEAILKQMRAHPLLLKDLRLLGLANERGWGMNGEFIYVRELGF